VNKKFLLLIIILFISHCSFVSKSSFWKNSAIKEEINKKELFKEIKKTNFEINPNLEIDIRSKAFSKKSFQNNLTNNNGRLDYDGEMKKALKFNFSKIKKLNEFEPEIIFDKDNLIFFSKKGSILKFDSRSKLIWSKNYYNKEEKKLEPILFFANHNNILIVADSIAKFYALNINSGELLWSKKNTIAFNSELKIYKDHFFVIDYKNILRCFSIKDGTQLWKVKTENSILKSQKKLSIVIDKNKVIFNNSIGDITAVDINTGNLLWIVPTLKNLDSSSSYFLKTSNLILNNDNLYFSTNKNEFYSIDTNSGVVNWIQNIGSTTRSTVVERIIYSISDDGYLSILESKTGEIIRRTDIFNQIKKKKRNKLKVTGFIVGKNKIYVSVNNGRVLIIDIKKGRVMSSIKIDNGHISRGFVLEKSLFVIANDGIIKIQ
jgi:outer membrane protein assembly factor BamB